MNKLRIVLSVMVFLLVACGNFNNPLSSENSDQNNEHNDTIMLSGSSDRG